MITYRDLTGSSGIRGYHILDQAITIRFKSGDLYRYDAATIGIADLKTMKALADSGRDLNTYINQNSRIKQAGVKLS